MRTYPALDGTVTMTDRRRELLIAIAFTDDIEWRVVKDYRHPWPIKGKRALPFLHGVSIHPTLLALRSMKLIHYWADLRQLYIKPKGMSALLDGVDI